MRIAIGELTSTSLMYEGKRLLAVIPARGGSKGLPGKNLAPLAGQPLIAWTIRAARQSAVVDRTVVTTDDEAIAAVSRAHGADVPFVRPAPLASDGAKAIDVLLHAMECIAAHGGAYDLVMYLQPTSPLRTSDDIRGAVAFMKEKNARCVVSVCKAEHPPAWSNELPDDLSLHGFIREEDHANRQGLRQVYRLNGSIYLAEWQYILRHRTWYGEASYAYEMPVGRSIDIDTQLDLDFAAFLLTRTGQAR